MSSDKRSLDKVSTSAIGAANGVCPLDKNGFIPASRLPLNPTSQSNATSTTLLVNGKIPLKYIPQGEGSNLDADTFQGKEPGYFARANVNVVCRYPVQGGGYLSEGEIVIGIADDVLNESFDHDKLQNIGTHSHAEIDGFIGLASESPISGAIPLADSSGKLNSWVDFDDFFEIDGDGYLVQSDSPTVSNFFEIDDSNYIVQK